LAPHLIAIQTCLLQTKPSTSSHILQTDHIIITLITSLTHFLGDSADDDFLMSTSHPHSDAFSCVSHSLPARQMIVTSKANLVDRKEGTGFTDLDEREREIHKRVQQTNNSETRG